MSMNSVYKTKTTMKEKTVSIIVPIYNVENCLKRCLDSILAQTYKDFELILIDDGSSDNSGVICDNYASVDDRINVIHQSNSGVSFSRNKGIEKSNGEYIIFIDSDDEILPTHIEDLLLPETDLSVSGITYLKPHNTIEYNIPNQNTCYNKTQIASIFPELEYKLLLNGPCQKCFKKSIIDKFQIRFDTKISSGEDTLFVLKYITNISSLSSVSNSSYIYHLDDDNTSLSTKRHPYKNTYYFANQMYILRKKIIQDFNINNKKYLLYIKETYQKYLYSSIYSMYYQNINKKERIHFMERLCNESDIFYINIRNGIKYTLTTSFLKAKLFNILDFTLNLIIK